MVTDSWFRSSTPQTDYPDTSSSRYCTPASEPRFPQQDLLAPRRMSIVDRPSFVSVSVDASENTYGAYRRASAPQINNRNRPSDQGLSTQPPTTKPPKAPLNLKLYPWLTQKDISPPRRTPEVMIKCPYPTNGCTDTLPRNIVAWRRHLGKRHGLSRDSIPQTCQWPGCGMTMGGRSLNRHVLVTHMDFKGTCPHCRLRRRYDHLDKHILSCASNPNRVAD